MRDDIDLSNAKVGDWIMYCPDCSFQHEPNTAAKAKCYECGSSMCLVTVNAEMLGLPVKVLNITPDVRHAKKEQGHPSEPWQDELNWKEFKSRSYALVTIEGVFHTYTKHGLGKEVEEPEKFELDYYHFGTFKEYKKPLHPYIPNLFKKD